jgi:hypothetical protein
MMKLTQSTESLLRDSINLLGVVKNINTYIKAPYKAKPISYESLPNDYIVMKSLMYEIFSTYFRLSEDEFNDQEIQKIFHSSTNVYKRTIRAIMSRLCEVLDTDCGLSICHDVYSSLLNMLEQISTKPHTDLVNHRDLVDLLGLRLLHLEEVITQFEIPLCYYDFFIGESTELDDLYEGIFVSAYK